MKNMFLKEKSMKAVLVLALILAGQSALAAQSYSKCIASTNVVNPFGYPITGARHTSERSMQEWCSLNADCAIAVYPLVVNFDKKTGMPNGRVIENPIALRNYQIERSIIMGTTTVALTAKSQRGETIEVSVLCVEN